MSATGSDPQVKGMSRVLVEIVAERHRQDAKWGRQDHPDGTGPEVLFMPGDAIKPWSDGENISMAELRDRIRAACQAAASAGAAVWWLVAAEELFEAFAEEDPAKLRAELVQLTAVGVAWIEAIDRRVTQ